MFLFMFNAWCFCSLFCLCLCVFCSCKLVRHVDPNQLLFWNDQQLRLVPLTCPCFCCIRWSKHVGKVNKHATKKPSDRGAMWGECTVHNEQPWAHVKKGISCIAQFVSWTNQEQSIDEPLITLRRYHLSHPYMFFSKLSYQLESVHSCISTQAAMCQH